MGLSNTFHSITEAHFGNWTIKSRKPPTLLSQQLHPLSQQSIIAIQLKIKILLYRSPVSCSKERPGFDANTAATSRHQMAQLNMFFSILCTSLDSISRDSKSLGNLFLFHYFTFQNTSHKGVNLSIFIDILMQKDVSNNFITFLLNGCLTGHGIFWLLSHFSCPQ